MRIPITALILLLFIITAPAQKGHVEHGQLVHCPANTHAHRFSDMRIAVVEVVKSDECGFSYVDLEDQTTGANNYFQFADNFVIVREQKDGKSSHKFLTEFSKQDIKGKIRSLAIYCSLCKAVLSARVLPEDATAALK